MAYTLLDAVNRILKRVRVITGTNGELASLTDSPRQPFIDVAVQVINEGIHELYSRAEIPVPTGLAESNITLVDGQREYDLPAALEMIRWPLIDQTNGQYIVEYPGGFEQMRVDQLQPANWNGLPLWGCLNPTNNKLRLDVAPTSDVAGRVYVLLYGKRLSLTLAADTFPFTDTVVDSMVPAWVEFWKLEQRKEFNEGAANLAFGRAARYLSKRPLRNKW